MVVRIHQHATFQAIPSMRSPANARKPLRTDGRTDGRTDMPENGHRFLGGPTDSCRCGNAIFQPSDRRTAGQPENIMPPAPKGGGIKMENLSFHNMGQNLFMSFLHEDIEIIAIQLYVFDPQQWSKPAHRWSFFGTNWIGQPGHTVREHATHCAGNHHRSPNGHSSPIIAKRLLMQWAIGLHSKLPRILVICRWWWHIIGPECCM